MSKGDLQQYKQKKTEELKDKVEVEFRKREAKRSQKEEEKRPTLQVQQVIVERPHSKDELLGLDLVATLRKHGVGTSAKSIAYYINTVNNFSPHSSDSEDRAAYKSLKMEMIHKEQTLTSR